MLDPKRLTSGAYYMFTRQMTHGSGNAASPETVRGMLDGLGDLLKLLDISSWDHVLLTTYGKLQPPLGKHRLKENSDWADWQENVLSKRNSVANIFNWACGLLVKQMKNYEESKLIHLMLSVQCELEGFRISNSTGTLFAIISTIGSRNGILRAVDRFVSWFQAFLTLSACLYFARAIFWNHYATEKEF